MDNSDTESVEETFTVGATEKNACVHASEFQHMPLSLNKSKIVSIIQNFTVTLVP